MIRSFGPLRFTTGFIAVLAAGVLVAGCSKSSGSAGTPIPLPTVSGSPGASSSPSGSPSPGVNPSSTATGGTPSPIPSISPTVAPSPGFVPANLYVSNAQPAPGAITVYSLNSNGNPAPLRAIVGPATQLSAPAGMSVDYIGNLYVANYGYRGAPSLITVYPPFANANVGPGAVLAGGLTGLAQTVGVAFDQYARLYALDGGAAGVASVQTYLYGTSNNGRPIAALGSGLLSAPSGIAADPSGNINVANFGANAILTFPSTALGASPVRTIVGSNTQLNGPLAIAIGPSGRTYVVQSNAVLVFEAGVNGNVAPSRVISGSNTGITNGVAVTVDPGEGIYVASQATGSQGDSIVIFAPGANGNVSPVRSISGAQTQLGSIQGLTTGP